MPRLALRALALTAGVAIAPTVAATSAATSPAATARVTTPPTATSRGATSPGTTPPDTTSHAATSPGTTPPDTTSHGATSPGTTPPDTTSHGATSPGTTPPDTTSHAASSPGTTPPGATSHAARRPQVATRPAAASPAAGRTVWLCRPGRASDPCTTDRTTTAIAANGDRRVLAFPARRHRRVDCFYVYPTVSAQPTINADRRIDARIRTVATFQASRFSSVCRVFAPVYRQVTLSGLTRPLAEARRAVDRAYRDVWAAWRAYLARDNHGRGIVLIGHSQGTGLLTRLVAREIDPRPAVRRRLVSALLLGGNVLVPAGRDAGGSFQHVPACRSRTQTGCVVAYSSYLQAPPDPSLFARGTASGFEALFGTGAAGRDLRTLCVNPAAPGRRAETPLQAFFHTGERIPWVTYPGRYRGRCATAGGASWLQVDPRADDPRPVVQQIQGPAWGLHVNEVDLTLGDLVRLVNHQSDAYARRHRRPASAGRTP